MEAIAALCWICRERPAANVGGTVTEAFPAVAAGWICQCCDHELTAPYDRAWQTLEQYLRLHWHDIVKLGRFDLSKPFPADARAGARHVHLYFVKSFGAKLLADSVAVDLASFSRALLEDREHPEVSLFVADARVPSGSMRLFDSEVRVLRNQLGEVQSALWTHLAHPIAIKVNHVKAGAPLQAPPGNPWHPARQRRIVVLSPFVGEAKPIAGPQGLRI